MFMSQQKMSLTTTWSGEPVLKTVLWFLIFKQYQILQRRDNNKNNIFYSSMTLLIWTRNMRLACNTSPSQCAYNVVLTFKRRLSDVVDVLSSLWKNTVHFYILEILIKIFIPELWRALAIDGSYFLHSAKSNQIKDFYVPFCAREGKERNCLWKTLKCRLYITI